jgi:hypothetical protein
MSGQRMVIAGLQVVVVGALLGVIYFTLLKPDDDGSLFGVDAPQDTPQVVQESDRDRDRPDGDERRRRSDGDAGPRDRLVGFGGGPPPGTVLIPGQADGGDGPGDADDTPGGDQYNTTLARLQAMLDGGR